MKLQEEKKNYIQLVRELHPQVHCITNVITINDCANALLAIGAAPTMSHHPMEVADVAKKSDALVLNMGAMESLEAMKIAGFAAKEAGHPIVLDPVGAGGAAYRREQTLAMITEVKPDCIRGNASELRALAENLSTTRGVEVAVSEAVDFAQLTLLSKKLGCILVVSGKTDYVIDGSRDKEQETICIPVSGGSAYMPRVTGTGCMSSAMLGAFLAAENRAESAAACLQYISDCAEKAEARTKEVLGGTMSFRMYFIDELSK